MTTNWSHLNPETHSQWDENAAFWDDYMGDEGNHFYQDLIKPTAQKLLDIQSGQMVLETGCGNGNFARYLTSLGANVVATDFSKVMIDRASAYPAPHPDRISYQVVDATNTKQLLALGTQRFDAAVSNMALMDMANIEPLLQALAQLLKPGGCFVFSLAHPCFQSNGMTRVVEESDEGPELVRTYGVKITSYITPKNFQGIAVEGQPVAQNYFHRPLGDLLQSCFQAGFVINGLAEPTFANTAPERPLSWANFREIPPVLFVRLRL